MRWLLLLTLILATGCRQEPAGYADNIPSIEDAPVDRHLVVFGESRLTYWRRSDGAYFCDSVYSIEGWVDDEVNGNDVGCTECAETYTLSHTLEDTNCDDYRARGPATIALMDFAFFPFEAQPESTWQWLQDAQPDEAADTAFEFGLSNWSPASSRDAFDVVLGVFEPADPDPRDWVRQLLVQSRYYYALNSDHMVGWQADLRFTE